MLNNCNRDTEVKVRNAAKSAVLYQLTETDTETENEETEINQILKKNMCRQANEADQLNSGLSFLDTMTLTVSHTILTIFSV